MLKYFFQKSYPHGIRYKKIREERGLSQQELADIIDVLRGRVNQWERRGTIPKTEDYEKIKQFVSETNVSENEPYRKKCLRLKNGDKENKLMYYDVNAEAGTATPPDILAVKESNGVLYINDLFKGSQYAIRVSGNSMIPNYPPGAIIGIREIEDKQITPGSVYVVQKDDALWIKRLFYKNDDQGTGYLSA